MKNPIRTYLHYNGTELVKISKEPALKAIAHYGKLSIENVLIGAGVSALALGGIYVGFKIKDAICKKEEDTNRY